MYASILAGGSGTRLWPLSTKVTPKQFLRLTGERTMLQETVERVAPLVPLDQLYVVTFANYVQTVASQLPGVPIEHIVAEPAGRGTAASIGLAATLIAARDPHAVMGSFPADHVIADTAGFRAALAFAEEVAREGYLVTLGITPHYPETGYGYIQHGAAFASRGALSAYEVSAFVEKPRLEVAESYLRAGNYAWNAGIFVWRVDRILEELRLLVPTVAEVLAKIGDAAAATAGRVTPEVAAVIETAWPRLTENITIDVGVMEKAQRIAVIPVSIGWNDIGNWAQVATLGAADDAGNTVFGPGRELHVQLRTDNTLIYSTTGRPIATAGVEGLVIVDTPEGLLICSKAHTQLVKDIAEQMQRQAER